MEITNIKGNTFCLQSHAICVPFYVLEDNRIVLLDSGPDTEPEHTQIIEALAPYTVAAIISTHAHPDHTGGNVHHQSRGAKIYMPRFEAGCLESVANLKAWHSLFSPGEVARFFSSVIFNADYLIAPEEKSVTIEGASFEIYPAPGHTMDQICVMTPDRVLYLADALLSEKDCRWAKLPYTFSMDLDGGTREMLASLEADAYILAHGGVRSDITELIAMNEKCFAGCCDRVLGLIDKPMSIADVVQAVIEKFNLRPTDSVYVFRIYERNTRTFLENLVDTGRIEPKIINNRLLYVRCE